MSAEEAIERIVEALEGIEEILRRIEDRIIEEMDE